MRQLGVVLVAVLMATFLFQGTAAAQRENEWCAEDPLFNVLGSHFRVNTTIFAPASSVESLTYVVIVPADANGSATAHFPQGGKLPTSVVFSYSGPSANGGTFDVTVQVTVDAPSGTSFRANLSGPSVTPASWQGATPATLGFTFNVTAK